MKKIKPVKCWVAYDKKDGSMLLAVPNEFSGITCTNNITYFPKKGFEIMPAEIRVIRAVGNK